MRFHPMLTVLGNHALRKAARNNPTAEAAAAINQIRSDGGLFEDYLMALPSFGGVDPEVFAVVTGAAMTVGAASDHPILDAIAAIIQKIAANPQGFIDFIMMIVKMFGG